MLFSSSWGMTGALLLLLMFLATADAGGKEEMTATLLGNNNKKTFRSIPLVPHHAQKARRLAEWGAFEDDVEEEDESVRRDRQRQRHLEAQQVGALYQGYGTHYVDLWCGSPPQRQTVIVDTGSSITAFPCEGCKDCGVPQYHVDLLFDPDVSSSFAKNSCETNGCKMQRSGSCGTNDECHIRMSYAEGSRWDAYEAVDSCYVGGPHEEPLVIGIGDDVQDDINPHHAKDFAFDLVFGCQTLVTGLFKTQLADGIMGMDTKPSAYWKQMYDAGKMGDSDQFSLCFARQPTANREGTEAGAMTLGGTDVRLHLTPMVYTTGAMGGRSGFFSVHVRKIWLREGQYGESAQSTSSHALDGTQLLDIDEDAINKGGIIVDSGTTDTYWNRGLSQVFQAAFQQMAGRTHSNSAVVLSEAEFLKLPTILFQIQTEDTANLPNDPKTTPGLAGDLDPSHPTDVILAFPASHYMEYDVDTKKYTSRFYVTEGGGSVLGANAMMGHDIKFDAAEETIGWAESACDYTHLLQDNGFDFPITGNLQPAASGGRPNDGGAKTEPPTATTIDTDDNDTGDDTDDTPVVDERDEDDDDGDLYAGNWGDLPQKGYDNMMNQGCDSPECRYPLAFGLLVVTIVLCCCSYCFQCLCFRPKRSSEPKFTLRPNIDLDSLPMTADRNNGHHHELELSVQNNNGGYYKDEPIMAGGDTFVDEPHDALAKPEFAGDFH